MAVNYAAAYWTPPMTPKLAFDLESRQIEKLDLAPMVSLTDHDNIKAPMLLRTVPSARQIPVSVEWSAPYGVQSFHLGIHNLPSAKAPEWMQTLEGLHGKNPSDARLTEILDCAERRTERAGDLQPPDVGSVPGGRGEARVPGERVSAEERQYMHALELNGLRHWDENRAVGGWRRSGTCC
jgi:hypothetical protein